MDITWVQGAAGETAAESNGKSPAEAPKEVAECLLELCPPERHAADKRGFEETEKERLAEEAKSRRSQDSRGSAGILRAHQSP